jgi:hypothetical protein
MTWTLTTWDSNSYKSSAKTPTFPTDLTAGYDSVVLVVKYGSHTYTSPPFGVSVS